MQKQNKNHLQPLKKKFGEIDLTSSAMPFDFSDYYNPEMGDNLKRFWISFKKLITAADIAGIKIYKLNRRQFCRK